MSDVEYRILRNQETIMMALQFFLERYTMGATDGKELAKTIHENFMKTEDVFNQYYRNKE